MASKSTTSRKAPVVREYAAMADTELFRELARLYDTVLDRCSNYLDTGRGDDEAVAVPESLEQGLAFAAKICRLENHFQYGTYGDTVSLTGWNWGIRQFEKKITAALTDEARDDVDD